MNGESRNASTSRQSAKGAKKAREASSAGKEHLPPRDYLKVIHDLQVHRNELAHQTEELREVHAKLEESRSQYEDLYDNAPVGYFSLDGKGRILAVNLTGSGQLGLEKKALLKKPLTSFMSQDDSDLFYLHLKKVFATKSKQTCSLTLCQENGKPFYAQLDSIPSVPVPDKKPLCLTTVTDIEERRKLEREVKEQQQVEQDLVKALEEIRALKDRLVVENIFFRQEISRKQHSAHIIGQSDGIKYILYRAEQVAPTDTTVLVLGETGTGKELIATAIHNLSPRSKSPLITVNCAALPANLLESELFGREKGAFTGAETRQIGRFEVADGSTLCLDEIGELPLEMQAKLLRVIQHGEFERLGSSKTIKVDVRIVATTNRNLDEEVAAGRFRKDLFYRLNVFPITVPPLRQRKEDIPLMVEAFVERYARKLGKRITSIPKKTMQALQNYPWPGNVRELESIVERAVILSPGSEFKLADTLHPPFSSPEPVAGGTVKEMERTLIAKTLSDTQWRIEGKHGAAALLGLHPSTLRARMHKLGIKRPATSNSK
ncbi:MAG: sigma 54-interacting transcriptional regulator [Deltaproteobacteria bacterium]